MTMCVMEFEPNGAEIEMVTSVCGVTELRLAGDMVTVAPLTPSWESMELQYAVTELAVAALVSDVVGRVASRTAS